MNSPMHLYKYYEYPSDIHFLKIRSICGSILHNLPVNEPAPLELHPNIIGESTVKLMHIPSSPIIKMARKEHVDLFFNRGVIRLGSFQYFNQYDHKEIGDTQEGRTIVIGKSLRRTIIADCAGGFDRYIFCCYTGLPDEKCIKKFGYDDAFIITDPVKFAEVISQKLNSLKYEYAKCVYNPSKVMIGIIPQDYPSNIISHHLLRIAGTAKYYLKPDNYSHQCEFRFTWEMPSSVASYIDIECPEALEFCIRK